MEHGIDPAPTDRQVWTQPSLRRSTVTETAYTAMGPGQDAGYETLS